MGRGNLSAPLSKKHNENLTEKELTSFNQSGDDTDTWNASLSTAYLEDLFGEYFSEYLQETDNNLYPHSQTHVEEPKCNADNQASFRDTPLFDDTPLAYPWENVNLNNLPPVEADVEQHIALEEGEFDADFSDMHNSQDEVSPVRVNSEHQKSEKLIKTNGIIARERNAITHYAHMKKNYIFADNKKHLIGTEKAQIKAHKETGELMFEGRKLIRIYNYFFTDTHVRLTYRQKKKIHIDSETRAVSFDNRALSWNEKQKRVANDTIFLNGKTIQMGSFFKRTYFYDDNKQEVPKEEQKWAEVDKETGKLMVDGRSITWETKIKSMNIRSDTPKKNNYYRTQYIFADNKLHLLPEEKKLIKQDAKTGQLMFGERPVIQIVNYFFAHSEKPLTERQIRTLKIDKETRVPTFKGEKLTWSEVRKQTYNTIIYPYGKRITVRAFLLRNYIFEDDKQDVLKSEQKKFKIDDKGVVRVNGRVIIWKNKKTLPTDNQPRSPEKETRTHPSSRKRKREETNVSDGISSGLTFFNSKKDQASVKGNTHAKKRDKDLQPSLKKKHSMNGP